MNTNYVVVGVVAIVLGVTFAAVGWLYIVPYREDTSNADAVDAVVVSSGVVEATNAEGQAVYAPNVTYRYTYEGVEYTSSSVFPGDVGPVSERDRARDIVERYPPKREVTAYVNAADPSDAFLVDRQAPLWFWGGPAVGALCFLYGMYSVVLGVRGVEPSAVNR